MRSHWKKIIAISVSLAIAPAALAVPGEDGTIVLSATGSPSSVILNSYTTLSAGAAATAGSFQVTSTAALTLPACPANATCTDSLAPSFGTAGMGTSVGPGDLLMIYQPQDLDGAITTTNDNTFGAVTDLGSAGLYEFVYVLSVDSGTGTITFVTTGSGGPGGTAGSSCTGLKNTYDAGAMVVRVPQLNNLTVNNNRRVTAPAWNGTVGGVVALQVAGRGTSASGGFLAFDGDGRVDVTGLGFRGGTVDNLTVGSTLAIVPDFVANTCVTGGRRGESVFGWSGNQESGTGDATICGANATGLHVGRSVARGALANAGGGGNSHNAGGGGGANGGVSAAWSGGGNPDPAFLSIWGRELQYSGSAGSGASAGPLAASGTVDSPVLNASSGGGRGGYTFSQNTRDATRNPGTQGPQVPPRTSGTFRCGIAAVPDQAFADARTWGGNCRANLGGLGGRPLNRGLGPIGTGGIGGATGTDRLYFGGGGGAGDGNQNAAGAGGSGGGLAFIMAKNLAGGAASRILANGLAGENTVPGHTDAPGGGGAGGTVALLSNNGLPSGFGISAQGGAGGNQLITTAEAEGPGGGGGGGVVAVRALAGSATTSLAGGTNGTTSSTAMAGTGNNPFPPNGATRGGSGESIQGPARDADVFQCLVGQCSDPNAAACTQFSTPVTNAWFASERTDNGIRVRFATAAEVANAGFWLEGAIASDAARGNKVSAFIPAQADDPASPRYYEVNLTDTRLSRLWLVDVSADGVSTRRGPYEVGSTEGQRPELRTYDWTQAEQDALTRQAAQSSDTAYLTVSESGMHRLTHEALLAAGVNLAGTPKEEIALWSRRGPVPRAVQGPALFGPGSVVEFYGDAAPDLYSRSERYLLGRRVNPGDVIEIPVVDASWSGARGVSSAKATAAHVPPRWFYDLLSPSGSPWYQYDLTATSGPVGRNLSIPAANPSTSTGTLLLRLYGGIDLTDSPAPDHHVRVLLNGAEVASRRFDGITLQEFRVPVSNVLAGNNTVRVELPFDTGFDVDSVVIVSAELEYETEAQVRNGSFRGTGLSSVATLDDRIFANGSGDTVLDCQPIVPTEPNTPDCIPLNFRMTQVAIAGRSAAQSIWMVSPGSVRELRAPADVGLAGASADSPASEFVVADRTQLPQPAVQAATALTALPTGPVDYLVIAHPAFIEAMGPLLAHRQAQGLRTAIVDVEQLYRRYTAGNAHPHAIRAFMREHAATLGLRYLVLAGGANYNSVGLLPAGNATLSHIPAPYLSANRLVRFAPADAIYGDLTGDYLAEVSVGRLPVRTVAEAQEAVRKLVAYEAQPASGRILMVSGGQDQANGLNFRNAVADFAETLPSSWLQSRVDVDVMGAASAREALFAGLATGASVISYTGHSAPAQWGFEPLLTASQVGTLPTSANQPLLLQFGCWTTYFLSPVTQTMSNAWMLSAGKGASAVFGSTVLLDQPNHDKMAAALGPRLVAGQRLGDAIDAARAELAEDLSMFTGNEILIGITLLGDPATVIR